MTTSTAGNDRLFGTEEADLIRGLGGSDTIDGFEGDDTLDGGDGADSLDGGNGDDSLIGGSGNDFLYGGTGNNSLLGGSGNDLLETEEDFDLLDGGDGNDTLSAGDGDDRIFAGSGADLVFGSAGDDYVDGGTGNDSVEGGQGFDTLLGGDGEDSLDGGEGDDSIYGGLNNDSINGGDDEDSLDGGNGNDFIEGGNGEDTLNGGAGDDLLVGDLGNDSLDGGAGNDTLNGGLGFDTLDGNDGNDYLDGEDESDFILGGNGEDSIFGGSGDDTIYGGADSDIIEGGGGDDLIYSDDSSGVQGYNSVLGGDGFDTLFGGGGSDLLDGGEGNDSLNGGGGDDLLEGGDGDDTLDGGAGDDKLSGDSGADTIRGGAGNDTLEGGEGNDLLYGEAGDDILRGEAGDDSFFEGLGNQLFSGGTGYDSAVFDRAWSNYKVQFEGDRVSVSSQQGKIYLLDEIEFIAFSDRSVEIDSLRLLLGEASNGSMSPKVEFAIVTSSANEGNSGSSAITVEVILSEELSQDVTVPLIYSGTATASTDYASVPTSVTIAAGKTTASLSFSVVGDVIAEPNETVVLTMGTPINAILGANTVYTHMIVNDDTASIPAIPSGIFLSPSGYIAADSAKVNVYGTAGVDTVLLGAGSSSVVLDQNVDRIYLSEAPSAYRFQQSGIRLDGYSLNGSGLVFSAALQADADGTVLVFPGGTVSAKVSASGMRIGDVLVPSSAPTSILPTLSAYVTPPTGPSGAGVFLSQGASFVAASSGLSLYGAIGIETVSLKQGVSGIELDQAVERVQFDGLGTAGLRFQQQGIGLLVYNGATLLARVPLQNDADGTLITTTDGTMQAKVSAAGMRLGGALVSQTVPTNLIPVEVVDTQKASFDVVRVTLSGLIGAHDSSAWGV